jgi:hypothetical protein
MGSWRTPTLICWQFCDHLYLHFSSMLSLTYFKYKVQKEIKKLKMNHIIIAKIKRRGKEMEWADSVNELYRKIESGYGLFILARDSLSTCISPLTSQHTSLQHARLRNWQCDASYETPPLTDWKLPHRVHRPPAELSPLPWWFLKSFLFCSIELQKLQSCNVPFQKPAYETTIAKPFDLSDATSIMFFVKTRQ